MRRVWRQTEAEDVGEEQKNLRELLKEDKAKYLAQMASMEKDFRARGKVLAGASGSATPTGAPDEATGRVVDLIDRLLDQYTEQTT